MSEAEACAVPRHPVRAVVLAGGAARRLGGVDKPGLRVGAATLLDGVLAALGEHTELGDVVVVGPPRELPRRVRQVSERPPGAGPLAALKAGVAELGEPRSGVMLVLAADLAGVDTTVLGRLVAELRGAGPSTVAAVGVDPDGRYQWLLAAWRVAALLAALTPAAGDAPVRSLYAERPLVAVPLSRAQSRDIDTPQDLRSARAGQ